MPNRYKKQLDQIHMSDELKQKIINESNKKESKKRSPYPRLIVVGGCAVAMLIMIYMNIVHTSNDIAKKEVNMELATNNKVEETYEPQFYIGLGSMGGLTGNADKGSFIARDEIILDKNIGKIKELPVYEDIYQREGSGLYIQMMSSEEQMKVATSYAEYLGIDLYVGDYYTVNGQNENASIRVDESGQIRIDLNEQYPLDHMLNKDELLTYSQTIFKKYDKMLSIQKPIWNCKDKSKVICKVFEDGNDLTKFKNEHLNYIDFYFSYAVNEINQDKVESTHVSLIINNMRNKKKLGNFKLVDEKYAREILLRGGYYSSNDLDVIQEENILRVNLIYGDSSQSKFYSLRPYVIPMYRYTVINQRGTLSNYDVPALSQSDLKKLDKNTWYFEKEN